MEPNLNNTPTDFSGLPKKKNSKAYVFISFIIFLLIIILAVFYKQGILPKKEIVNLPPAPQYTRTDFPVDKLPGVFPEELAIERDAKVLENFTISLEGGFTQSTRSVESNLGDKLGLEKVFEIYRDKLKEQKWLVAEEFTKSKEEKKLSASKESDAVVVLFKKMEDNSINIYMYAIIKTKK